MAALVAVSTLTASALAQKNELTGIIGRTFVSDRVFSTRTSSTTTRTLGEGLSFEVNCRRHLMGNSFARLTLERPAVISPDQDVHFARTWSLAAIPPIS